MVGIQPVAFSLARWLSLVLDMQRMCVRAAK
jgi:hypothetical protein